MLWIKKKLKKNFYIYLVLKFLYVRVYLKINEKIRNHILFNLNRKRNSFFKANPKEKGEAILFGKTFFYPKRSLYYKKFLENFEDDKISSELNILKKSFFDEKSIDFILDVGANIGYQTLFYKSYFASNTKILCFEPHPISYFFLNENLSQYKNISLYNFALGDRESKEIISVPKHESHRLTNLGIASISKNKTNHLKEEIQVKKFDDLDILKGEYKSIFIKIDVEGYEKKVLLGMNNFLKKKINIFLQIEINKNYQNFNELKSIVNFLSDLNYSFFVFDKSKLIKLDQKEIIKICLFQNNEVYCKKLV